MLTLPEELMDILLRVYLFGGMLLHKVVWEYMKQKSPAQAQKRPEKFGLKSVIKIGKIGFLLLLFFQAIFLAPIFPLAERPGLLRIVGVLIYSLGLLIAISGRIQLGKNWANLEDYQVMREQKLVEHGIYRWIRHPIYSGDLLLVLGVELALNSWLALLIIPLAAVVYRQAKEEEKILSQAFSNYPAYRERTKMFLPFVI
ncbi:MAG: isoprenylcysteine carboxylmethyltransferase family protein [Anaerolineales bacterium]|nr:isoprenylcysteine carboxylmethyltransferase family protein [Anaerolineales bacterium]